MVSSFKTSFGYIRMKSFNEEVSIFHAGLKMINVFSTLINTRQVYNLIYNII